jgi:hypothetical protein
MDCRAGMDSLSEFFQHLFIEGWGYPTVFGWSRAVVRHHFVYFRPPRIRFQIS